MHFGWGWADDSWNVPRRVKTITVEAQFFDDRVVQFVVRPNRTESPMAGSLPRRE
jgi:hypothetical protein